MKFPVVFLSLLVFVLGTARPAAAQYCALRDPVRAINELYPGSTFSSSVRTINEQIRKRVSARLPQLKLHFDELGQHTLYKVFKEGVPVGFVHVRSERTRYGLTEIAWALDLSLRIQDFRFQRCRSVHRSDVERLSR